MYTASARRSSRKTNLHLKTRAGERKNWK
jgi:hypothetical protein